MHNQSDQTTLATTEQIAARLEEVMVAVARQIVLALPVARRSESESQWLHDATRRRKAFNETNVAKLLVLQSRAGLTAFSDEIARVEASTAPAIAPECLVEVSLAIEEADVAVDRARVLYAKEPTPTRASVLWETLRQLAHQVDRGLDQCARVMHLPSRSRA